LEIFTNKRNQTMNLLYGRKLPWIRSDLNLNGRYSFQRWQIRFKNFKIYLTFYLIKALLKHVQASLPQKSIHQVINIENFIKIIKHKKSSINKQRSLDRQNKPFNPKTKKVLRDHEIQITFSRLLLISAL